MATVSPVRIANMALSNIGARSRIESLSEQSTEAKECNLWYDFSRLSTLEGYDWNFARKRQKLSLANDDPPEGLWAFRYQYPADCVHARQLENPTIISVPQTFNQPTQFDQTDAIPFEVETIPDGTSKSILTDMEEATLVFTFNQEQTSLFTPFFVKTLSYHLASQIAIALTGKISLQDSMLEKWQMHMASAQWFDAQERVAKPPREAEWIRGRR